MDDSVFTGFGPVPSTLTHFKWEVMAFQGSVSSSALQSVASCPHLNHVHIVLSVERAARDQFLQTLLVFHIPDFSRSLELDVEQGDPITQALESWSRRHAPSHSRSSL